MSRGKRESRVSLDRLSREHLSILRVGANGWLIGKAEDLRLLQSEDDPERVTSEVAALGRLTSGLERGEVFVPDPGVAELVGRRTNQTIYLDELKEEYDRELAEQEAWSALLGHFDKGRRR